MNVSFQFSLNNFFHNDAKIIWLTVDYGRPWFDVDVEGLVVGHSNEKRKRFFNVRAMISECHVGLASQETHSQHHQSYHS